MLYRNPDAILPDAPLQASEVPSAPGEKTAGPSASATPGLRGRTATPATPSTTTLNPSTRYWAFTVCRIKLERPYVSFPTNPGKERTALPAGPAPRGPAQTLPRPVVQQTKSMVPPSGSTDESACHIFYLQPTTYPRSSQNPEMSKNINIYPPAR